VTRRWLGREPELERGGPGVVALGDQIRSAQAAGDAGFAPVYAGQSAGLVEMSRSAAEVVAEFGRAADLLERFR
jgi:nitronate monooxygenase